MKTTLIEKDARKAAYDFTQARMILDHEKLGRILLSQGFGGVDQLCGGCYRWRHGSAIRVPANATLESLDEQAANGGSLDYIYPVLDWEGAAIARIAESHGG